MGIENKEYNESYYKKYFKSLESEIKEGLDKKRIMEVYKQLDLGFASFFDTKIDKLPTTYTLNDKELGGYEILNFIGFKGNKELPNKSLEAANHKYDTLVNLISKKIVNLENKNNKKLSKKDLETIGYMFAYYIKLAYYNNLTERKTNEYKTTFDEISFIVRKIEKIVQEKIRPTIYKIQKKENKIENREEKINTLLHTYLKEDRTVNEITKYIKTVENKKGIIFPDNVILAISLRIKYELITDARNNGDGGVKKEFIEKIPFVRYISEDERKNSKLEIEKIINNISLELKNAKNLPFYIKNEERYIYYNNNTKDKYNFYKNLKEKKIPVILISSEKDFDNLIKNYILSKKQLDYLSNNMFKLLDN